MAPNLHNYPHYIFPLRDINVEMAFNAAADETWVSVMRLEGNVWARLNEWREIIEGIEAKVEFQLVPYSFEHAGIRIRTAYHHPVPPKMRNAWKWDIVHFERSDDPITGEQSATPFCIQFPFEYFQRFKWSLEFVESFKNILAHADPTRYYGAEDDLPQMPIQTNDSLVFERDGLTFRIHFGQRRSSKREICIEIESVPKKKLLVLDAQARDDLGELLSRVFKKKRETTGGGGGSAQQHVVQWKLEAEFGIIKECGHSSMLILKDRLGNRLQTRLQIVHSERPSDQPRPPKISKYDDVITLYKDSCELLMEALNFVSRFSNVFWDEVLEREYY